MPNYESGFLHALLNGGVSYVKYNYTDTEIARVKTVSQLHGKVALSEMLSHEFIGGDLKRQRTVFSDGTVVEVDFRQNTYHIISEKKE